MDTEIKALIVEDELKAGEALADLMGMVRPSIKIIGVASTVNEAVVKIQRESPTLIFLDIQLEKQHSFEILKQFPEEDFQIIFITAYSNYAIDAFKFSAVDYLLKPVDPDRLESAVDKAVSRIRGGQANENLHVLLENLQAKNKPKKIVLSTLDFVHVVDTMDIVKCHSSINYTTFHLVGGKELLISKTLKEFDEQLSPHGFFRAHKSWLLNVSHVKGYDRKDGGFAIMKDDSKIPISLARKEAFMERLESFS